MFGTQIIRLGVIGLFATLPLLAQEAPVLPDFSSQSSLGYSAGYTSNAYGTGDGFGYTDGAPSQPRSYGQYVGTRDHRVPLRITEYPWTAIGKIITDDSTCTGSLVGRDLVLTNAHCVLDEDDKPKRKIAFHPNYIAGKSRLSSLTAYYWYGTPGGSADWALLRLQSPLGNIYGWLGTMTTSLETAMTWKNQMVLAGYSGDYFNADTAGIHLGCSITGDAGKGLGWYHNCDMNAGASGAPIFSLFQGLPAIVALNWGDNAKKEINVAAPIRGFVKRLNELKGNAEGRSAYTYVHLCNHASTKALSAALAYYEDDNWHTKGWYTLAPDTCVEVAVAKNYTGPIALHGQNVGHTWGNGPYLCVESGPFNRSFANTNCNGGKAARFFKEFQIRHGIFNLFRFTP